MSVFSDGSLDITNEGLQELLAKGISPESRETIEKILASVRLLSNVEKLFLYLRLPTHVPLVNKAAECTKTSNDTESLAFTWVKTHLTRNAKTSLLRQKVYDDYRMFCEAHHQEAVSVSDFKKILSAVFPGLTTRRLGSRGNAKHMFGGISYLIEPSSFTVPKVKAEDDNQEAYCDDSAKSVRGGRVDDQVTRAASRLVLEWAFKLLSIPFESIQDLALHLISKSYVSQVSEEAFTLTAGTNCSSSCRADSSEEIPAEKATQKQLHTRHQLQRKLQERREITRQKQRMEEERHHLAHHESLAPSTSSARQTSQVPTQRNLLPGVSRTPVPKSGPDHNPRKGSVPTILPKTLLPKLLVESCRPPPVYGIEIDPRAARRVEPPQFILLSPTASQLQPRTAAGSLVFISNSVAPPAPPAEAKLPIQAVVKNVSITQAESRPSRLPAQQHLSRITGDVTVVSASSVAVPVRAEGCYDSRTCPLETAGVSPLFPGSAVKKNAESMGVVCSVVSGFIRPLCPSVTSGCQRNLLGYSLAVDNGDVQTAVVSQEMQSATVTGCSALSVSDVVAPLASAGTGLYADKALPSTLASLASKSVGCTDDRNLSGISDRWFRLMDDKKTIQTTDYSNTAQLEFLSASVSSVKPASRTTSSLSQSSKARGRNMPSRSSTKTVSSILDEQRCSNGLGGSRAMKFYNDSRNVSQILKELREKSIYLENDLGMGGPTFVSSSDLDRNAVQNPYVCKPVVGIVPPSIQIVQVLPPCSTFQPTEIILQSTSAIQMQGVRSSTGLDVQTVRPIDSTKLQSLPTDGGLQSPVRLQTPGMLSDVLLSSKPVLHLIQPSELNVSQLTLAVSTAPKAETGAVFELQRSGSSVFSFTNPLGSRAITSSGSGFSQHVLPGVSLVGVNQIGEGGKRGNCGIYCPVADSTSGIKIEDSLGMSFGSSLISIADCRTPSTLDDGLNFLRVPVVVSTSESTPSVQFMFKPVESLAKTSSENSVLPAYGISLLETTKLGQVNVARSTDSNNRVRSSSVKRSIAPQSYCGIKKLLLGDDRPKEFVERPAGPEYFVGETGRMETGKAVLDSLLNRLHSPGDETNPMPYKNNYVQHCTLQQLSQVSALRMLQQARLRQQTDLQPKQGSSRPASAVGNDKTGPVSSQGSRPSRPNTVAGSVWDSMDFEMDSLDARHEPSCPSAEGSRGSRRSTPMSVLSPRSNLSGCSLYLDQSNVFMPIQITDSLPSVTAIKPLPKLGQRHRFEMEGFGVSQPGDVNKLAAVAAFTMDARSFVPYTSTESPRVMMSSAACGRSGGFVPVSSIRPLKRGGQCGAPSRQRHHSAHDFQNSCNKIPQGLAVPDAYEGSSLQQCLPPPAISIPEPSAFGVVASSSLALLPGAMMPPDFDFQDLETAGEVEEIIGASQELSAGAGALAALQRSRSEPANCLQTSCPFDLDEMIHEMLDDAVADSSEVAGNLSSHGSRVDWNLSSDKRQPHMEKHSDAQSNREELRWTSSSRDRLISGVELQPSLAFSDGLNCGDLNPSEFEPFGHSAGAFIGDGCTPPLSQNSSPEFASEMPLFDKPDKDLETFPAVGGQSTALDTPNSLEGLFGAICSDDSDNHGQSASCSIDFSWSY